MCACGSVHFFAGPSKVQQKLLCDRLYVCVGAVCVCSRACVCVFPCVCVGGCVYIHMYALVCVCEAGSDTSGRQTVDRKIDHTISRIAHHRTHTNTHTSGELSHTHAYPKKAHTHIHPTNTYTHAHTHTHGRIHQQSVQRVMLHTHTHAQVPVQRCALSHGALAHIWKKMHTHTQTHGKRHTHTQTHKHRQTHTNIHSDKRTHTDKRRAHTQTLTKYVEKRKSTVKQKQGARTHA